jgi:signal transduction histidine kinase
LTAVCLTANAQSAIDSAVADSLEKHLLTHPPVGAEGLQICCDLSDFHYRNYAPYKNIKYAQQGITIARSLSDQYQMAYLYNNIGVGYDDLSKYDSAMIQYKTALAIIDKMSLDKQISEKKLAFLRGITYSNIGNLHNVQGLSDQAIDNYLKSISEFEKTDKQERLSKVFRNLALVYINMNNYEQAEQYLQKSVQINQNLNDSLGLASTLTRLAHVYVNQMKYEQAMRCAESADSIYALFTDKRDLRIYNLRVLCAIYNNGLKDEQRAMKYALQALEESRKMGFSLEISRSLQLLAALHLEHKNYLKTKEIALQALQTDSSNLANNVLLYEDLMHACIGLKELDESQRYFDYYKRAMTAYSNASFQSSLAEMEVKYQTVKREILIAKMNAHHKMIIIIALSSGGILIMGIILLIVAWQLALQRRRKIELQLQQLEQEKLLVATQAALDGEVQERSRLARDLHDGLGGILAAAKFNVSDLQQDAKKQEAIERIHKAIQLIDDSMREMRRIAHHLMPETLQIFGLKRALEDFCKTISTVKFAWYGEESRFDQQIEIICYRIMHELVSNAMKHAKATQILVEIVRYSDHIAMTVQDNGCGFDVENVQAGMGLQNIRNRIAAHSGILLVDSQAGQGTEISVELKIET